MKTIEFCVKPKLESRLLRSRNVKPSTPVAHSVAKKESHISMSLLLNGMNYKNMADVRVLLLGLQTGCTKYSCFIFVTHRTVENVTL